MIMNSHGLECESFYDHYNCFYIWVALVFTIITTCYYVIGLNKINYCYYHYRSGVDFSLYIPLLDLQLKQQKLASWSKASIMLFVCVYSLE